MLGYINLPKWRDYFLRKLIELDLRDMVSCPVMGRETAESPWQTLDNDDFLSSVDTAVSFVQDKNISEFGGKLITIDAETAINRLLANKYEDTFFSGAIGGVFPLIKSLCSIYQTSKPVKFFVQNDGVVSYILSAIENNGKSLDEAINESQWEKIAETSPIKNIHGLVARNRFILLVAEIFGLFVSPDNFNFSGINNLDVIDVKIAKKLGFSIRLLGIAEKTSECSLKAVVEPCLVPSAYMLAQARGGSEIIYVKNSDGLSHVYGCPGASVDTCINGILHDYYEMSCSHTQKKIKTAEDVKIEDYENSFYVRFETSDKTSDLASVLNCFKDFDIKVLSVKEPIKSDFNSKSVDTVVFITNPVNRKIITKCLEKAALNIPTVSFKSFYRFINHS